MFNTPCLRHCTSKGNPVFSKPSRDLDKDFVEISVIRMVRVGFRGTRHLRRWFIYEERFAWVQTFWGFGLYMAWWQKTKTAYSMAAERQKEWERGLGTKYILQCHTPLTSFLQPGPACRCCQHWVAYEVWICKGFSPSTKAPHPFPRSLLSEYWCIMNQTFSVNCEGTFQIQVFSLSLPLGACRGPVLELPMDVKIQRCSSPFHKMAYCLHTTYTHILLNTLCHLYNNVL